MRSHHLYIFIFGQAVLLIRRIINNNNEDDDEWRWHDLLLQPDTPKAQKKKKRFDAASGSFEAKHHLKRKRVSEREKDWNNQQIKHFACWWYLWEGAVWLLTSYFFNCSIYIFSHLTSRNLSRPNNNINCRWYTCVCVCEHDMARPKCEWVSKIYTNYIYHICIAVANKKKSTFSVLISSFNVCVCEFLQIYIS